MQLIMAIVQDRDADAVLGALTSSGRRVTRVSTTGGFLQQGNTTLLIGLADELVDETLALIRTQSRRRTMYVPMVIGGSEPVYAPAEHVEVEIGGASVFVLPVEQFAQL